LEEQTHANLQKIADRLGIRVSKGLAGALTQAMFGPVKESRRQYIETLANSDLVTLEDIDRILRTHYARLPDDTRGMGYAPRTRGTLSDIFMQPRPETRVERFVTLESLIRHILDNYVTKSDLQKICQILGLNGAGNKGDLQDRILGDSSLTSALALNYVNRDDMKKLCVDLKLPTTGTRGDMESRVAKVMARLPRSPPTTPSYEPQRYTPSTTMTYKDTSYAVAPQQTPVAPIPHSPALSPDAKTSTNPNVENERPIEPPEEIVPPPPPPSVVPEPPSKPSIPARPELGSIMEFIKNWWPSQRFENERLYQVELATELRHRFPDGDVKTEVNVAGGRIDIVVFGVGIEIKVPTKVQLQRLIGQVRMYRRHYGPNVAVVIFKDIAKVQDINEFSNDLADLGIKCFVK
jgi:hypothetical protein